VTPGPELGGQLHRAATRLAVLGDRVLAPARVTAAQWKVLVLLARGDARRVSDLVALLGHDQAAVSRLVARMTSGGLLSKQSDPSDKRAARLRLTRKGRAAHARCERVLAEVMGRLEAGIGRRKTARLAELLLQFNAAIDDALEAAETHAPAASRSGGGARVRRRHPARPR
jgi:DNA-binding MarR family transcriptional regulator